MYRVPPPLFPAEEKPCFILPVTPVYSPFYKTPFSLIQRQHPCYVLLQPSVHFCHHERPLQLLQKASVFLLVFLLKIYVIQEMTRLLFLPVSQNAVHEVLGLLLPLALAGNLLGRKLSLCKCPRRAVSEGGFQCSCPLPCPILWLRGFLCN